MNYDNLLCTFDGKLQSPVEPFKKSTTCCPRMIVWCVYVLQQLIPSAILFAPFPQHSSN